MNRHLTMLLLPFALLGAAPPAEERWRDVVPREGEPLAQPPVRALALRGEKPADLKESVRYQGKQQRYAQLVYGTGRTAPVAIVVDEINPGRIALYVDADRDRAITPKDRVAGDGLSWRVPLEAVVHQGETIYEYPRTVQFRYGSIARTLAVATCGYVEGTVALGGKRIAARRADGDANGLFGDAQDRLWLDLNGDGRWDPGEEEFLLAPILRLGERRFAVQADAQGKRLRLSVLEGTGKVGLALPARIRSQVDEIQVTLQSRDGVVVSLRGVDAQGVVPTGEYRVSSLLVTLRGARDEPAWGFIFSDNGGKERRWHRLARDGSLAIDPVGKLQFETSCGECKAGEVLAIQLALYTGDGLLIERAFRGSLGDAYGRGWPGQVVLRDRAGEVLASTDSGFA